MDIPFNPPTPLSDVRARVRAFQESVKDIPGVVLYETDSIRDSGGLGEPGPTGDFYGNEERDETIQELTEKVADLETENNNLRAQLGMKEN